MNIVLPQHRISASSLDKKGVKGHLEILKKLTKLSFSMAKVVNNGLAPGGKYRRSQFIESDFNDSNFNVERGHGALPFAV